MRQAMLRNRHFSVLLFVKCQSPRHKRVTDCSDYCAEVPPTLFIRTFLSRDSPAGVSLRRLWDSPQWGRGPWHAVQMPFSVVGDLLCTSYPLMLAFYCVPSHWKPSGLGWWQTDTGRPAHQRLARSIAETRTFHVQSVLLQSPFCFTLLACKQHALCNLVCLVKRLSATRLLLIYATCDDRPTTQTAPKVVPCLEAHHRKLCWTVLTLLRPHVLSPPSRLLLTASEPSRSSWISVHRERMPPYCFLHVAYADFGANLTPAPQTDDSKHNITITKITHFKG